MDDEYKTYLLFRSSGILIMSLILLISLFIVPILGRELLFAQDMQVSGTVSDAQTGETLPGVNVLVKGTTTGTSTNSEGSYKLAVPSLQDTLIFSFIGYQTIEVPINGRSEIDLALQSQAVTGEELVVVGYGTTRKENLTGSVSAVRGEKIAERPAPNVQNLLQGRVPGLQITQSSGEPGDDTGTMRIRGIGTFSGAGSSPLVLIDGVAGNLSDLDPDNVESVSVLKDAASASIYGARAANGVILVTTKRGRNQDISVEYHTTLQAQKPTRLPDVLTNSAQYMELWNEANRRSGKPEYFTQEEINAFRNNQDDPINYPNFDWIDHLISTAFTQKHHLSVNGGNDKTTFNLAMGFLDQGGIVPLYSFDKYNLNLSVDTDVTDWLSVGGDLKGLKSKTVQDVQGAYVDEYFIMHVYGPAPNYRPTMTLPDGSTGYVARYSDSIAEWTIRNPEAILAQGSNVRNTYGLKPQIYTEVKLADNFTWYTKGAVDFLYGMQKNHEHAVDNYFFKDGSYAHNGAVWHLGVRDNMDTDFLTTLYSTLNYQNSIKEKHNVDILAGFSQETADFRSLFGSRIYFPTDNLKELNAGSSEDQSTSGTASDWALQSFFGRLKYSFDNKYLFEANARYDGTSRIAPDTRWGLFPSASAAWRLTEETFMEGVDWLDELKLRASWGKLGNQNVGLYPYHDVLSTTAYYFNGLQAGARLDRLVDKTLKWETTSVTDFGLDINIKDGLVSLEADWFNKVTDDILYTIPVPASVGLSPPTVNGGKMKNTGWEFVLGHRQSLGEFIYSTSLNFSTYKNEVVNIISPTLGRNTVQEGLPYNSYYLIEWDGIFQSQNEIDQAPDHPYNPKPGDLRYKDQNGDGVINAEDRVVVDGFHPDFYYGGSINLTYKNFDVSAFFQGVQGVKAYLGGMHRAWGYTPFVQGSPPAMEFVENRWTEDNPTNEYPAIFEQSYGPVNGTPSTFWLKDASYFRLKNLRISYTVPVSLTEEIGLKNAQVYVSGDNLLTITDYPGSDPERPSLTSGYSVYPQLTTYAFGIKVKI